MAGSILASSVTGTIAVNESLNTLAAKLYLLFTNATFQNFSDDEAGSTIAILRTQATAPTAVVNDTWHDTTARSLRTYEGATGQERWQPRGDGMALKNSTGTTRADGDVVGFAGTPGVMEYNNDATAGIGGVVSEISLNAAFGMVRMAGRHSAVKVSGAVARGDFLKNNASSSYEAVSGGTTLNGAFGWALTAAAGPGSGTVVAYLFPWNKT